MPVYNRLNCSERELAGKMLAQAEMLLTPIEFGVEVQHLHDWKRAEEQVGRPLYYADFVSMSEISNVV